MTPDIQILPLVQARFDDFLAYLEDHLSDNGAAGASPFQPLARADSTFGSTRALAFSAALRVPVGKPGWRRAWIARTRAGMVVGHVDLRGHDAHYTAHRCLLGMGVDRQHRGAGLGAGLLATARAWAEGETGLRWIDLQALSTNEPALHLYRRAGFVQTGEVADMFRIDGRSLGFTSMSLSLGASGSPD